MKNRKVVQYVLYPKLFHSLSILYKGTYCISFKMYHTCNNKTVYAYPFIVNHPDEQQHNIDNPSDQPTIHFQSNFSYQTEKFSIIYEQDTKKLRSQCVFRLQYQQGKIYNTFLSCKLMKKIKREKKQSGLCTKATTENKYQILDTETFKINKIQHLNNHHRLFFHSSEFFSCVDFCICSFNLGAKWWRNKQQLSDILSGYTLRKCNPKTILQQRTQKKRKQLSEQKEYKEQKKKFKAELKDLVNSVLLCYFQLQNMIEQYDFWYKEIVSFRKTLITEFDERGRKLAPLKLVDLSYLNRERCLSELQLRKLYGTERQEETLVTILEEKELLRYNIRAARQYLCMLLFYTLEKKFVDKVVSDQANLALLKERKFVSFQSALIENQGGQIRNKACTQYGIQTLFCPEQQALIRIPMLLVEGYQKLSIADSLLKKPSLTVFVHGYQGNSFDFQKSKNYLKRYNKNTSILIVESITTEMDKSIEQLGKKVAEEVVKFVEHSLVRFETINFIGFSLGGLLVRACLDDLGERLRSKLGVFVSFSSPHLGISQSDNNLVKLGVWYLIKVDKVKNLKELNFQSVKLNDSLLMKLSKNPHISNFSKVVLVSSKDDGFVPLYSTFLRPDLCQNEILDLCNNLLGRIKKLERVEVLFNTQNAGTIDKLTGRRGHIEFLDNHYFLEQFFRLYGPYF